MMLHLIDPMSNKEILVHLVVNEDECEYEDDLTFQLEG